MRTILLVTVTIGACLVSLGAQEKKKSLRERLSRGIEKLSQQPDAATGAKAPDPGRKAPAAEGAPPPDVLARMLTKRVACVPSTWQPGASPDPALSLPSSYVLQYQGDFPVAPEPPKTYALEDFGRTRTMRVTFPPAKYRVLYKVNGKEQVVEPRDEMEPFEQIFTLDGDILKVGVCDQKAVFHEGLYLFFQPNKRLDFGTTTSLRLIPNPQTEACPRCYFVNKVFQSGTEARRYVILVNPDIPETPYYVIPVNRFEGQHTFNPTGNLCLIRKSSMSGCGAGAFEHIEVTQEAADNILYPGQMTSRWYIRCAAQRCEQRSFADIVDGQ